MTASAPLIKDLGAAFDAHIKAEFVEMDVTATMATMTVADTADLWPKTRHFFKPGRV